MKTQSVKTSVIIAIIRTIVMTVLSFIAFPYICRILGDSQLGIYSWAAAFVYYFNVLAKLSIPNVAVRECIKVRNDPEKLSMKVQEFFILQGVMSVISFALMSIIVLSIPNFGGNAETKQLVFILSLNFLVSAASFEWVYIALEKHFYLSIRSIIAITITDILIFLTVVRPKDIELYAFYSILTTIILVVSNVIYLPKHIKFKKTGKYNFKQYYRLLATLFIISIIVAIYEKTDTVMLGIIDQSKAEVGSYAVGNKAVEIIIALTTALTAVFMPRASDYYHKNDEKRFSLLHQYSGNICLFITIPAVASLITLAKPITALISGNYIPEVGGYNDAYAVLIALASLMITYSLGEIIYTQILIPIKKEKLYMFAMIGGAVLNIGLSALLALVPFKNNPAIGVAIGTAVADFIILCILVGCTWKYSKPMLLNINTVKLLIAGGLVALIGAFAGPAIYNLIIAKCGSSAVVLAASIEIAAVILIGGIVYIGFLYFSKERLVRNSLHK